MKDLPSPLQEVHEEHCNDVQNNHYKYMILITKQKTKNNYIKKKMSSNLPGTELKSPQTNIGMSALAAIFSKPFKRVWT